MGLEANGAEENAQEGRRGGGKHRGGARDRERGLTRCGGEPLEGGTGTMRQGEHLEGEAGAHARALSAH